MTHIIGKPPAPKRGATFADVPVGGLFRFNGHDYERVVECVEGWNARKLGSDYTYGIADDAPVTLLDVTPREPEPDPAVTTYGELEPGSAGSPWKFFAFPGWDAVQLRTEEGHVRPDSALDHAEDYDPVIPVPASVVIHEESGTYVKALGEWQFFVEREDGVGMDLDISELRHIVQQGAALFAQQAASPESEPPHCQETGEDCKQACVTICKKTGMDVEPAEDRSKPAPGWEVIHTEHNAAEYTAETKQGVEPIIEHSVAPWTEGEAVAWTWAQHDAQPAEPAEDRSKPAPGYDAQQAEKGHEFDPKLLGGGCLHCGARPMVDGSDPKRCWAQSQDEPAEDRSKPAPGVSVDERGHGSGYSVALAAPMSSDEAVRLSWALHDARQAEKGGDS